MKIIKIFIFSVFISLSPKLIAQELTYTPINPSFGGSPFNASWLMASAQAQDKLTGDFKMVSTFSARDALADFEESIKRQILNQFSRQIITNMFGETELAAGEYQLGDFFISISKTLDGINIQIIDNSTGSESNIVIPYL
jgi:curli production assembly/transport component CsgF